MGSGGPPHPCCFPFIHRRDDAEEFSSIHWEVEAPNAQSGKASTGLDTGLSPSSRLEIWVDAGFRVEAEALEVPSSGLETRQAGLSPSSRPEIWLSGLTPSNRVDTGAPEVPDGHPWDVKEKAV